MIYHISLLLFRQIVKLNKQREADTADQSKQIMDFEVQVRDLKSQISLVEESREKLELQIKEMENRSTMDSDERAAKLLEDLQVCFLFLLADPAYVLLLTRLCTGVNLSAYLPWLLSLATRKGI